MNWPVLNSKVKGTIVKSLQQIQAEVGEWSLENFGQNVTKARGYETEHGDTCHLGSLCSVLGMMEESGELSDAMEGRDTTAAVDAIGDIGIYLCDFASRENFCLTNVLGPPMQMLQSDAVRYPLSGITGAMGMLSHAVLKHHQGIRGMDDPVKYYQSRDEAVRRLVFFIDRGITSWNLGLTFLQIIEQTWNNVVSKRNWKSQKERGVEETTVLPHSQVAELPADEKKDEGEVRGGGKVPTDPPRRIPLHTLFGNIARVFKKHDGTPALETVIRGTRQLPAMLHLLRAVCRQLKENIHDTPDWDEMETDFSNRIGQAAYEAFCKQAEGTLDDAGTDYPRWEDLKAPARAAWSAAAEDVYHETVKEVAV